MHKILGACILIFTFFLVARVLCDKRRRRLALYEELCRFLKHIKREMECYARPVLEIAAHFESAPLADTGLVFGLASGVPPMEALSNSRIGELIGADAYALLRELFSGLGGAYLEAEVRAVGYASEELDRLLSEERRRTPERIRLFGTLAASASAGLLILVL